MGGETITLHRQENHLGVTTCKNFQVSKLVLEKAEEPEIKLPVFIGDHRKGKRIPEKKKNLLH